MTCRIDLESVTAHPPYRNGNEPLAVTVIGRVSSDCSQVRVAVSVAGPGTAVLADRLVAVDFSGGTSAPGSLPGLATLVVALPPQGGLRCGDRLHVVMSCSQSATACRDEGFRIILCKPDPASGGDPNDPNSPGGPGSGAPDPGGSWPAMRCLFTAAAAAFALIAALASFATGVALQNAILLATAAGLLLGAWVAWSLWAHFCAPNLCTRLGVLCWVFKRAFLAAIPVFPFMSNMAFILVFIAYGAIAGILVDRLLRQGCHVPSARLPLTQLPI